MNSLELPITDEPEKLQEAFTAFNLDDILAHIKGYTGAYAGQASLLATVLADMKTITIKQGLQELEGKYQIPMSEIDHLVTADEATVALVQCYRLAKVVEFLSQQGHAKESALAAFYLGQLWSRLFWVKQTPDLLSSRRVSSAGRKGGTEKRNAYQAKHQLLREKFLEWKKEHPKQSKNTFVQRLTNPDIEENRKFWDSYWYGDLEGEEGRGMPKAPLSHTQIKTILKGL